ncbi:hypothetical protein ACWEPC_19045 [Nonomuraea sp. NPDC004297]
MTDDTTDVPADAWMEDVRQIARAVLYEGYLLWPYRESSLKNRHRWTIGGVHPEGYGREHAGNRWRMRTQCLVRAEPGAEVAVSVRFLHVVRRDRGEEAREREVRVPALILGGGPVRAEIDLPEGQEHEGAVTRRWAALRGHAEVRAEWVRPELFRVTADVVNTTPWPPGASGEGTRAEALARTFVSAHTVLHAPAGRFVSLMDPPEELRAEAEGCRNDGAWPVLAGEDLRTMLSAPIILYDQPKISPESPGDLFDATEIDQLLTLSVLALCDQEQAEIREGDPRAREILDRCTALSQEELMRLHGIMRRTEPTT